MARIPFRTPLLEFRFQFCENLLQGRVIVQDLILPHRADETQMPKGRLEPDSPR